MHIRLLTLIALFVSLACSAQKPEWCRDLPRPAYSRLERVSISDKWFEVYRIRPGIFAIYEPHQQEEIISYLILGNKRALLFDTGMGISDIRKVVEGLTPLPVSVMNSHTHNDHVGDNWRFNDIYGMDTAFTRENAKGSRADAQEEVAPDAVCGSLPAGFDAKAYVTRPFHITHWIHGGESIDLGGRVLQVIPTPGHTPDSISLWDSANRLLFTGDMYYPGPIFLYRPETISMLTWHRSEKWMRWERSCCCLLTTFRWPIQRTLPRVIAAMQQARSGKIKPVKAGNKWEYKFEGFSFMMKK